MSLFLSQFATIQDIGRQNRVAGNRKIGVQPQGNRNSTKGGNSTGNTMALAPTAEIPRCQARGNGCRVEPHSSKHCQYTRKKGKRYSSRAYRSHSTGILGMTALHRNLYISPMRPCGARPTNCGDRLFDRVNANDIVEPELFPRLDSCKDHVGEPDIMRICLSHDVRHGKKSQLLRAAIWMRFLP